MTRIHLSSAFFDFDPVRVWRLRLAGIEGPLSCPVTKQREDNFSQVKFKMSVDLGVLKPGTADRLMKEIMEAQRSMIAAQMMVPPNLLGWDKP